MMVGKTAARLAVSWVFIGAIATTLGCGAKESDVEPTILPPEIVEQGLATSTSDPQPITTPCVISNDCDDGNLCTTDVCDLLTFTCKYTPVLSCCNNPQDCPGGGVCSLIKCVTHLCLLEPITGCTIDAASDAPPPPSDAHSDSTSNEGGSGVCIGAGNCDDSDPCSLDLCVAGLCVHADIGGCCNTPSECSNGPLCTLAQCLLNVCVFDPIVGCGSDGGEGGTDSGSDVTSHADTTGSDGASDSGPSACSPSDGNTCSDNDSCTLDICVPVILQCVHSDILGCCGILHPCPQGQSCDNGVCTCAAPGCDAGTDAGNPPGCTGASDCDDGDACTLDLCTPGQNVCSHAPLDDCGTPKDSGANDVRSDGGQDGVDGSADTSVATDSSPDTAIDVSADISSTADAQDTGTSSDVTRDILGDSTQSDASGDTRDASATDGSAQVDVGADRTDAAGSSSDASSPDVKSDGGSNARDAASEGEDSDIWDVRGGGCSCRFEARSRTSWQWGAWVLVALAVRRIRRRR